MSVHQAAAELSITASALYRWLNDGYVPGGQITPGAPWRIRLTDSNRALVRTSADRRQTIKETGHVSRANAYRR
jgi:hypothetical protein